jgi:hypothetical protein
METEIGKLLIYWEDKEEALRIHSYRDLVRVFGDLFGTSG